MRAEGATSRAGRARWISSPGRIRRSSYAYGSPRLAGLVRASPNTCRLAPLLALPVLTKLTFPRSTSTRNRPISRCRASCRTLGGPASPSSIEIARSDPAGRSRPPQRQRIGEATVADEPVSLRGRESTASSLPVTARHTFRAGSAPRTGALDPRGRRRALPSRMRISSSAGALQERVFAPTADFTPWRPDASSSVERTPASRRGTRCREAHLEQMLVGRRSRYHLSRCVRSKIAP